MRKVTVDTEKIAYRGIETTTLNFANGDRLEIKAWDNEHIRGGMDYSIKLTMRDGTVKELA